MIFTRLSRTGSSTKAIAYALAFAAGGMALSTALEAPALAKKEEKQAKANYSKEFVAAYKPLAELVKAETPDVAAMKAAAPGLVTAATTDDDKMAAGNMLVQIGQKTKDNALQLQGVQMMLDSGKLPADRIGLINFAAGQLEYQENNYAKARDYLQKAIAAGYAENNPEALIAESYFQEKNYTAGLKYLDDAITARKAAGKPISEAWIKRGLAIAYNNKLDNQAAHFAYLYASEFPGEQSWGDAIAVSVNAGNYDPQQIVDLYRLALKVKAMRTPNMYNEFIQSADSRKLPNEVLAAIAQGVSAGTLNADNAFIKDAKTSAEQRIQADKKDLAAIEKDARSPSAKLTTVLATADAMLDYNRYAEAIEMYNKALGMPGADQQLILTRIGIAQTEAGDYQAAEATFAKVQGKRASIAKLWKLYDQQQANASAATTPAAAASDQQGG